MVITGSDIIGEVVAMDYRTAAVFKESGIDFCCNGNRSIDSACTEKKIESGLLLQQLKQVLDLPASKGLNYQDWPIDLLANYIEQTHHAYVNNKIKEIYPYLNKICSVHGTAHPELFEVRHLFDESAKDLAQHMKKEELILFPFIKKMVKLKSENSGLARTTFRSVTNPIEVMHEEHDAEGERFRKIASLTNNYTLPEDGCYTYFVTLSLLREFEEDLHLHIHLENNILFPKAILLEKEVFAKKSPSPVL